LGERHAGGGLEVHLDGVVLDLAVAAERDLHHLEAGGRRGRLGRRLVGLVVRAGGLRRGLGARRRREEAGQNGGGEGEAAEAHWRPARYSRSTIRPSAMRRRRGVLAASSSLCVTMRIVVPSSRLSSKNSSWISRPVLVSRVPFGSSAINRLGR